MRGAFKIGKIAGIEIGVHYSWIFAFILFAWIFASGTFPAVIKNQTQTVYWICGIIMALGIFISVLLHELCHSLVAIRKGMKVSSIVFFIFGGVSNIESEPKTAGVEFLMAGAGPLSSFVLAAIFLGLASLFASPDNIVTPVFAVLSYLSYTNLLLGIFNIVPGFPLDGGRVLRSIIWGATKNLRTATLVAGNIGRIFGWALILFGISQIFNIQLFGITPNILNGVWSILIGWFLSSAADSSMREQSLQEHIAGVKVKDVMDKSPQCISPAASIESVVNESFMRQGLKALPVCNETGLLGIVTIADVKKVPQEEWDNTTVQAVMTRIPLDSVSEEDDLSAALKIMGEKGLNQIPVMSQGKMIGLLSRADIIRYLQTQQQLGIKNKPKPNTDISGRPV